jgi:hypothetical protein
MQEAHGWMGALELELCSVAQVAVFSPLFPFLQVLFQF